MNFNGTHFIGFLIGRLMSTVMTVYRYFVLRFVTVSERNGERMREKGGEHVFAGQWTLIGKNSGRK